MDREELLHYQRSNFNTFEDTTPFKKKTEIQMPSFGKIEIDNLQKTLRQQDPLNSDPYSRELQYSESKRQYGGKSYRPQDEELFSQFADMRLMGEVESMKRQQLDVLESLKQEMREIRELGLPNTNLDRYSSENSSSTTSYLSESKATYKELQLQSEKKSLEENLAAKMRIIQRMLNSERELQETIHQLRMELDNRQDAEDTLYQRQKDQQMVERLHRELRELAAEKDRLASENGSMKRQMLRKQFETKLFMEDNVQGQEKQVHQENDRRVEELTENLKEEKENAKQREEELNVQIENLRQQFDRKEQQLIHTFKLKENQFYRQTKDDLQKLDKLKNRIVKDAKTARSQYQTFDTEVQYQTVYGSLLARLQHQYTDKTSIQIEYSTDIVSKVDDYQQRRLKEQIDDLKTEVNRLNDCIEEENRKKRQFLSEIEIAKDNSQKEKEGLKRELADLRIVMKEYRGMAENNSLEVEVERLKRRNGELEREKDQLSRKTSELVKLERQESAATFRPRQSSDRKERQLMEQIRGLNDRIRGLELIQSNLKRTITQITDQSNHFRQNNETLKQTIVRLQKESSQDKLYIQQIQSALKPLQPRLPGILKRKSTTQDQSIINMLQQQCTILRNQVTDLQGLLQQSKPSSGVSLANNTPMNLQHLLHQNHQLKYQVNLLQQKINDLTKSLQDLEDQTEDIRKAKLNMAGEFQKEVGLYATSAETERKLKVEIQEEVKRLREEIRRLEAEKQQCLEVIKDLTKEANKKDGEVRQSETSLRSREIFMEKEITRLISENTSLKKGYEQQLQKLLSTHSEATRVLAQKYQKDIKQLQQSHQNLLNQLKQTGQLQLQIVQLTRHNKELGMQIKDKSMAVEHLWEIKKVEYANIMGQINTFKSRSRQL